MEETERRLKLDTYKNYLKENGNNETEYWKQYNDNDDNSKLDWGMAIVNKETEKEVDYGCSRCVRNKNSIKKVSA